MRAAWRDVLVMGLAAVAGSLDSWAYFGLGHVFVANMTGNTVMLGFSAATRDWGHAGLSAFVIGSYATGVFVGSLLTRPVRRAVAAAGTQGGAVGGGRVPWPGRTTLILGLEWALLVVAGVAAFLRVPGGRPADMVLLAMAGVAVGLQSAAMQAMSLPGIVTTYITGTWTTLVGGVARLGESPGGDGAAGKTPTWEQRLWMQGGVLVVYCASAVASGLLYRTGAGSRSGLLPPAVLLLVLLGALLGGGRDARAGSGG